MIRETKYNPESEHLPVEESKILKTLGFDIPCIKYLWHDPSLKDLVSLSYSSDVISSNWNSEDVFTSVPLLQQVFQWLRIKHNILANVYSNASGYLYEWHDAEGGTHRGDSGFKGYNDGGCWDYYEEAEIECLRFLIDKIAKMPKPSEQKKCKPYKGILSNIGIGGFMNPNVPYLYRVWIL